MIADGSLHVWEVAGTPVSMAIYQPPVHGIVHVSAGYTPPAHRRHGYTSACVGGLCALAFAGGATHCFGMVDSANAAAHGAYRGIGYRAVQSALEIVR